MREELLDTVRAKYGEVAKSALSNDHAGVQAVAEAFGYTADELTSIPAGANMGLSCGNPLATAHIKAGEVVLDLGSGGGLDVFLASKQVGPTGRAIGIDMTPSMIDRARTNAAAGGYTNVEFHLAHIDNLPLPDASVDCVISNCVLNLTPDKPAVFREMVRVLKPGGRLAISDIALKAELPAPVATSLAAYVGCISGALLIDSYRTELRDAGFADIAIVDSGADLNAYAKVENQSGCCSPAMDPAALGTGGAYACCAPASGASPLHAAASIPHASSIEDGSSLPDPSSLHADLASLLSAYDVNAAAASVKIYAIKPAAGACCAPGCCP